MRIVYMGTPDFAVPPLEALLAEDFEVVEVVTQPDRPKGRGYQLTPSAVKAVALQHGLSVFQPPKVNTAESLEHLKSLQPDLIVVVAFGQILKQELLNIAPLGIINVHASLLPQYRGAAPINRSILDGQTLTGVTTMYINSGLDTGDMILKTPVPIDIQDNAGTLHDKLSVAGSQLLIETVRLIADGKAPREQQDDTQACYAAMLKPQDELINWQADHLTVHNQIRGLAPLPAAYTFCQGKRLKVVQSFLTEDDCGQAACGEILAVTKKGLLVATAAGAILLSMVQPQGKGKMSAADFARGYHLTPGNILGELNRAEVNLAGNANG